jgi:hypothetical protein
MAQRSRGPAKKQQQRHNRRSRWLKWIVGLAVLGAIGYGIWQMPKYPYTERQLGAIDFSGLSASEKDGALKAANEARCTCNCGMALAQCVATDTTCPIRSDNIERIRGMVERVRIARPTS